MRRIFTLMGLAAALGAETLPTAVQQGFDHFYNLEYDQALTLFERAIAEEPSNPDRYNHLAQCLLFREMFLAGALESELVTGANPFLRRSRLTPPAEVEQRFLGAITKSLEVAQARLGSTRTDLRALYAAGVAYGLRGNWNFLVRKAYLDALKDLTTSRKLCNEVVAKDPSFIDAKLVQGVHDYVVGSLPAYLKVLGFLAGFRGDKQAGIATLEEVAARGRLNEVDAKILLGVVYRRERRPREAIPLLTALANRFPRNYLFLLEQSQMYADAGDQAQALAAIDRVEELRRQGVTGYGNLSAEKLAFSRGNIQFWYRDLDHAAENLSRAAAKAQSLDLHTGTMAWLRLGQTEDLRQRRQQAVQAYQQVLRLAPESDMAREAKRYLSSPYRREKS